MEELKKMLNHKLSNKYGLKINLKKTQHNYSNKQNPTRGAQQLEIDDLAIAMLNKYQYLH